MDSVEASPPRQRFGTFMRGAEGARIGANPRLSLPSGILPGAAIRKHEQGASCRNRHILRSVGSVGYRRPCYFAATFEGPQQLPRLRIEREQGRLVAAEYHVTGGRKNAADVIVDATRLAAILPGDVTGRRVQRANGGIKRGVPLSRPVLSCRLRVAAVVRKVHHALFQHGDEDEIARPVETSTAAQGL